MRYNTLFARIVSNSWFIFCQVPEEPEQTTPVKEEQSKVEPNEEAESLPKKSTKRTRGKRKSGEIPIDHESVIAKKNLRSSASRSAAAAAARQKLEAENAQRESENNAS